LLPTQATENPTSYERRQIFRLSGGLLIGSVASSSFPLLRTLATGRPKTVLRFKFTIEGGGKGSFDLNTANVSTPVPGTFGPEFSYFNAVSNFSFSGLNRNVDKEDAGWKIVPGLKAEFIGFPPGTPGILSGVNYPDGCSTGTANQCSITVAVLYLGNLAELPELSEDPNSYQLVGIDLIEANGQLNRINATDSKVIALPEVVDRAK
jgi:hypothetical protein